MSSLTASTSVVHVRATTQHDSGTSEPRTVRLTRRGRLLVLVGLVALLLAAFAMGRSASQASPAAPATAVLGQTTVHQGETLWGVARRIAPQRDPREVVAQLQRLNEIRGADLQIGQQLLLPAAA